MVERITGLRHRHYEVIATDPETFYCDRVPEGEKWYIESVSCFNDDTDNSECLVGIESGRLIIPIKQFINLTVDLWFTKFMRTWVFPGERLVYIWSGVTAADKIQFTCIGHRKID